MEIFSLLLLCFCRDRIVLVFEFGPYPSIPKGTRAAIKIGAGRLTADKSEWEAVVYKESGNTLILEVGRISRSVVVVTYVSHSEELTPSSVVTLGSNRECRSGGIVEVQGRDGVEEGVSRRP